MKPERDDKNIGAWLCVGLAAVVLVGSVGLATWVWQSPPTSGLPDAGLFGDFVGGHLSAGASLAGTLLFFAALMLQRAELELQRRELREGREVAKQQADALAQQTIELRQQNKLSQHRSDIELMRTYGVQARDLQDRRKNAHITIVRMAMRHVVETALLDGDRGIELLGVFLVHAVLPGAFWASLGHVMEGHERAKELTDSGWVARADQLIQEFEQRK